MNDNLKNIEMQPIINYLAILHIIGNTCSKKDKIVSVTVYVKDFLEIKFELSLWRSQQQWKLDKRKSKIRKGLILFI